VSSALALATTTEELLHLGHQIEAEGSVRVQVQPQISGGHELLVGLRRDEQFGWMLAIGFGGVLAEIVNEVRILPAPANELACRAAVDTLFRGRWSTHHRGLGPANVRAAAALAARLSAIAIEFDGNELELNPVIVNNGTARAVDWVAAP
jgi:succinyl-CoA synthetase beta subunit